MRSDSRGLWVGKIVVASLMVPCREKRRLGGEKGGWRKKNKGGRVLADSVPLGFLQIGKK